MCFVTNPDGTQTMVEWNSLTEEDLLFPTLEDEGVSDAVIERLLKQIDQIPPSEPYLFPAPTNDEMYVKEEEEDEEVSYCGKRPRDELEEELRAEEEAIAAKGEPMSREDDRRIKKLKRLLRNRESAQRSRDRKNVVIGGLQEKIDGLEAQNENLLARLAALEAENQQLRQNPASSRPQPMARQRSMTNNQVPWYLQNAISTSTY